MSLVQGLLAYIAIQLTWIAFMVAAVAPTAAARARVTELGLALGRESRPIESVKGLYVAGRIDEAELERRLEPILLREAPAGHPLPAGWEPLPPCEHDWIDIRTLGDPDPHELCGRCGDQR